MEESNLWTIGRVSIGGISLGSFISLYSLIWALKIFGAHLAHVAFSNFGLLYTESFVILVYYS